MREQTSKTVLGFASAQHTTYNSYSQFRILSVTTFGYLKALLREPQEGVNEICFGSCSNLILIIREGSPFYGDGARKPYQARSSRYCYPEQQLYKFLYAVLYP
jgi:hypothetical protein